MFLVSSFIFQGSANKKDRKTVFCQAIPSGSFFWLLWFSSSLRGRQRPSHSVWVTPLAAGGRPRGASPASAASGSWRTPCGAWTRAWSPAPRRRRSPPKASGPLSRAPGLGGAGLRQRGAAGTCWGGPVFFFLPLFLFKQLVWFGGCLLYFVDWLEFCSWLDWQVCESWWLLYGKLASRCKRLLIAWGSRVRSGMARLADHRRFQRSRLFVQEIKRQA